MPRLPLCVLLLFVIAVLPACEVLGPDEATLSARSFGDDLYITNKTQARTYYFVVGRGTAAAILWAPHLNMEESIAPGKGTRIAHENIFRRETEREVIVYWWHAAGRGTGREPGEIQSLVVSLW